MRSPSFTNKMQGNLSPMRRTPMLEQVNALPSTQGELPMHNRNRELHADQGRPDMRGHVVRPFFGVPISAGVLRRQAVEKCLEISANVPRGVLLYQQSGRRVPAKQGQKPGLDRMRLEPIQNVARNLEEPAPASGNRKNINGLSHRVICGCSDGRSIGNVSGILALLGRPRARGQPNERPKCGLSSLSF
jgi:hypothetical protein